MKHNFGSNTRRYLVTFVSNIHIYVLYNSQVKLFIYDIQMKILTCVYLYQLKYIQI